LTIKGVKLEPNQNLFKFLHILFLFILTHYQTIFKKLRMNASWPLASQQQQVFDPWSVPDSFTVYNFAPDYVKPLLHDHWKAQKAVHPLWAYFFGLYYFVMGNMRNFLKHYEETI